MSKQKEKKDGSKKKAVEVESSGARQARAVARTAVNKANRVSREMFKQSRVHRENETAFRTQLTAKGWDNVEPRLQRWANKNNVPGADRYSAVR